MSAAQTIDWSKYEKSAPAPAAIDFSKYEKVKPTPVDIGEADPATGMVFRPSSNLPERTSEQDEAGRKAVTKAFLSAAGAMLAPFAAPTAGLVGGSALAGAGGALGKIGGQVASGEDPLTTENLIDTAGTGIGYGATNLGFGLGLNALGSIAEKGVAGAAASALREPYTGNLKPWVPKIPFAKWATEAVVPRGEIGSVTNPGPFSEIPMEAPESARFGYIPKGPFQRISESPNAPATKAARAEAAAAREAVPLTESPNYPRIAAGREAAMREARESLPSGQYTPISESPYAGRTAAAREFSEGKPGPFNRISESPTAPAATAAREFSEGKPGPFNRISESPNRPPEPTGTALPRPLLEPNAQPLAATGSEGTAARWTNERVRELAAQGNRTAIEQANRRGIPLPENARYVMGDVDYPRTVLNPKETTTFAPTSTPVRDLARPQKSTGALLQIPRSPAVRETIPFGGPADTSAAERILDDPLATGAQKQAARHFLGMSP